MKKLRYFFICVLAISCEKELPTDDINFKEKMVVNALATNDDILKVHLAKTLTLADSTAEQRIEDAVVALIDPNGTRTVLNYTFLFGGKYVTTFNPVPNVNYRLIIAHPKFPTASSSFTIPSLFQASKATWKDGTGADSMGFPTGTITFTINDDPLYRNFYEISLFRFEDLGPAWEVLPVISENPEIAADPVLNQEGALLLEDAGFNGNSKELKFTTPFGSSFGNPYKFLVVVKSLSPDYYKYFRSLRDYRIQGGVFSDPKAIFNNINGGVGICAGASISKDTIR